MKDNKETLNKTALIVQISKVLLFYGMYAYLFGKYLTFIGSLEEPILVFIGLCIMVYVSLGRVFTIIGNILTETKFNKQ